MTDLNEIDWQWAVHLARIGSPKHLLKKMKGSLPGVAHEFLSDLLRHQASNKPGAKHRVDAADVLDIRAVLRHYDRLVEVSGRQRTKAIYGTKNQLRASMAKKFACSVGTIRDIEAERGAYVRRKAGSPRTT